MKVYPYYPIPAETKVSSFMTLFKKNRSWLDGLYARSYTMKMGHVKMLNSGLYIPNEPELIHRILVSDAKNFPKNRVLHEVLVPLLGDSIFTTNNNIWRKQRNLLTPSFEKKKVQSIFNMMQDAATDMMKRLEKFSDGKYHNIDNEMSFVTADTIFRTILSSTLSEKEGTAVVEAFVVFQEMSARIGMQRLFLIPKIFRLGSDKKYQESGAIIRGVLADIIRPRYEAVTQNKEDNHHDILASLLKGIDEDTGKPFPFKEILDQIAMLFLAGHETTASSMTWSLYLLALYPQHQEEAYQEVINECSSGLFTLENIQNLKFVSNVFKEALRLYPPVSSLARESAIDTKIRDKEVKKGSHIVVSPWLMHRNERYWEDPHMFNPSRFDNPKNITKNTYFPFGLGQRICIGSGFASQESILLLATILREYKVELQPNFTPDLVGRLTTRSVNGMYIKLIKR